MTLPPVYIRADRYMSVDPTSGLLDVELEPVDRIQLITPMGTIASEHCRTLPTHRAGVSPAVILDGFYKDAMTIGPHGRGRHRRLAIVNRGYLTVRARRHDGTEFGGNTLEEDYRGLNLHDWRGDANGCLTCPWMLTKAMIAALRERDVRAMCRPHGITGEPCVSLLVVDHTLGAR